LALAYGVGGLLVIYVPILKGREGELKAIANVAEPVLPYVLPIFELAPSDAGPIKDAYAFARKAQDSIPRDLTIAVDVGYLADSLDGVRRPMRDVAEDLAAWGIPMLPVLHLYDSAERMADVAWAAERHSGRAVVRLGDGSADPDDEQAEAQLGRLRDDAGLTVERCALVVDVFEVRSERDLSRVEPVVRKCVSWAQRYPWQSITVVSGAMPESLSDLPTNVATPIQRWDRLLWERVRELDVQYGDYGIAHPRMTGKRWAPMPTVRYTDDDRWWIYRWSRDGRDNTAVYDLCKALTAADHWPDQGASYSWGDEEIAHRAAGFSGPGNATSWRAWGTSHHLAHVVDHLT
jgi:hypothetical protein